MARARRGRGEGSISQRKDGLWTAQVSLGYAADGRRIRETLYGKTKKGVQTKLLNLQQDALRGLPVRPEKVTVGRHFEDWLRVKKPNVRESTFAAYWSMYNTHIRPAFGGLPLKNLDYRRVNTFYGTLDEKGLSKCTVAYIGLLLRAVLEDAVAKNLIAANPARLAARRTYRTPEARCLTQDELGGFFDAARGERLEEAFILAVHTGLRPGEWLGLTWPCVDWEAGKITVRQSLNEVSGRVFMGDVKTNAGRRTISLGRDGLAALRRQKKRQAEDRLAAGGLWQNDLNLVFTTRAGKPLRRSTVARRDLGRITSRAGLQGVTLHTLRHSHASLLLFAGTDAKTVSRRLGHANIGVTLGIYAHVLPGQDERAAEKMDEFAATLKNGSR